MLGILLLLKRPVTPHNKFPTHSTFCDVHHIASGRVLFASQTLPGKRPRHRGLAQVAKDYQELAVNCLEFVT